MDIKTLTGFFKWCTIINIALFTFTISMFMLVPDLVYKTQSWIFPISREAFNVVLYSFLAGHKLMIIIFNVVPLISLLIISKKNPA